MTKMKIKIGAAFALTVGAIVAGVVLIGQLAV